MTSKVVNAAWRMGAAALCVLATVQCARLLVADVNFHKDTPESLRQAIRLAPDSSLYYLRLSELDQEHSRELLEAALRLNRYNAQAHIELALTYEADGNPARAEQLLRDAFAIDHTYITRWSLANFYFRQNMEPSFWEWARHAAEMPSTDVEPLFALCWRATDDPDKIAQAIGINTPELLREYVEFLRKRDQYEAASKYALRLIASGDPQEDRWQVLILINRLLLDRKFDIAQQLWTSMKLRNWVVPDSGMLHNPTFDEPLMPVRFDWALFESDGLHVETGKSGLRADFSGHEPEQSMIAEQSIVLKPGDYELDTSYSTSGIPAGSGLHLEVTDLDNDTIVANSPDLSSDSPHQVAARFSVPPGNSLYRVRLIYNRSLGTTRITGTLTVSSIQLKAQSDA